MIRNTLVSITTVGADGVAAGAANTDAPICGKLLKIRLNFHTSCPNTADVTITERVGAVDWETLLTETDSATDVTRYPRKAVEDNAETPVTYDGTNELYEPYVISGYVRVAVAQANALDGCVVATIFWEE